MTKSAQFGVAIAAPAKRFAVGTITAPRLATKAALFTV